MHVIETSSRVSLFGTHCSHYLPEYDGDLQVPLLAEDCIPTGFFGLFAETVEPAPLHS